MFRNLVTRTFSTVKSELISTKNTELVSSLISKELSNKFTKLFAIVYVNGKQFKVSSNDLIVLDDNQPIEVGDKIKLDKILAVGSSNFTVLGRPLLDNYKIHVNATVVEKNISSPEVHYTKYDGKNVKHLKWLSREQTTLRINSIFVDPTITE
uniref:Large ribosomal subunit protein bL21m n=1 Tax=Parastrongyloides trichosuri TaxID=131310 RepID=A0A0N4ZV68_PARTI